MAGAPRLALMFLVGGALACERSPSPHAAPRARSEPARVVAGCASAVDYVTWLGATARLVAMPEQAWTYASGLPDRRGDRAPATFAEFRAEPILAATPELVLCDWYQAQGQGASTRALLEARGAEVVVLAEVRELADVAHNVGRVAAALADSAEGEQAAAKAVARLDAEAAALRALPPAGDGAARVLPYFNYGSGARTAGAGTAEHVMLALAGARNAAAELGLRGHVPLSTERVLEAPPDWFLTGDAGALGALETSPYLGGLAAVRERRFVVLDKRLRNATSPYVLEAAREIRRQLEARR